MNTIAHGLQSNLTKYIIFSLLVLFIISCQDQNDKLEYHNIKKIKIAYLPKWINPDTDIDECKKVFSYETVKDTIISDKKTIRKLVDLINNLEVSNDTLNYDFRIYCIIQFKNDMPYMTLCFGANHTIVINNQLMKDDKKIFSFFDELLY